MDQRRINLCFDLDNPRHKAVYDLLQKVGREKTNTVIQAVYKAALMEKKDTEGKRELEKKLTTSFMEALKENNNKDELREIRATLSNISDKLETLSLQPGAVVQTKNEEKPKKEPEPESEIEMNDDAFASVLAMCNPDFG